MRIARSLAAFAVIAAVFCSPHAFAKECLLGSERHLVLNDDGTPVKDDDIYSVEDAGARCGKKTSFLDTYGLKDNVVSVSIGGRTHRFLALALYDKTRAPKCNQIKVRNACFDPPAVKDGKTVVELYDQDTSSKGRVTFTFDARGNPVEKYAEYALIRADFPYKGKQLQMATRIHESVVGFQASAKSCANPRTKLCMTNKEAVAENAALERLRVDRFLHIASSQVNDDRTRFKGKFDGLSGMQAIIKEMLLSTELGTVSPYELSDATKGGSALSFGARQLDIGGNTDAKAIFTANLKDYAQNPQWAERSEHKAFIYAPRFQAPIQGYRVRQLYLMHDAMPALQQMMREKTALDRLDAHHVTFLKDEAARYAALRKRACFKDSPFLALVAVDRNNQRPADYTTIVNTVAVMCRRGDSLETIETEVTKIYGIYTYRARNIRKLIQARNLA